MCAGLDVEDCVPRCGDTISAKELFIRVRMNEWSAELGKLKFVKGVPVRSHALRRGTVLLTEAGPGLMIRIAEEWKAKAEQM